MQLLSFISTKYQRLMHMVWRQEGESKTVARRNMFGEKSY